MKGATHIKRQAVFVNKHLAENRIHAFACARHGRRRGGIAHQNRFITDDHAGVGVAPVGISPAVGAELVKRYSFVRQVGLRSKCFNDFAPGRFLGMTNSGFGTGAQAKETVGAWRKP